MLFMEFRKFLGNRIKEVRLKKGYTRGRLSELCGIHEQALAKYENGSTIPTAENLKKLVHAFDVSADFFLFEYSNMDGIPKIQKAELYEKYLILEQLNDEELKGVLTLLDALIIKSQFEKALKPSKVAS